MENSNNLSGTEKNEIDKGSVCFETFSEYNFIRNSATSLRKKILFLESDQDHQFNIYDTLKVSENRHSVILGKLLKFQVDGNYIFISSFIKRLLGIDVLLDRSTISITIEKYRIDLLIRDKTTAIIVENKIHGAIDQKEQLRRYIDVVKYLGIKECNVYVIYLAGIKRDYNLNDSLKTYQESFKERFIISSFKNDIVTWLEKDVYPNIKVKDSNLYVFVEQYIEHLSNRYHLGTRHIRHKNMSEKITKYLFESLELEDNNQESNINKLTNELKLISDFQSRLSTLLLEQQEALFNSWGNQLREDFPMFEVKKNNKDQLTKVGVLIKLSAGDFSILIEKNKGSVYFGIGRHFTQDKDINKNISIFCSKLLTQEFKSSKWWYGRKFTDYASGYRELSELIHKFIDTEYVETN